MEARLLHAAGHEHKASVIYRSQRCAWRCKETETAALFGNAQGHHERHSSGCTGAELWAVGGDKETEPHSGFSALNQSMY